MLALWRLLDVIVEGRILTKLGILREDGGGPASPVNRKRGSNAYFLESSPATSAAVSPLK